MLDSRFFPVRLNVPCYWRLVMYSKKRSVCQIAERYGHSRSFGTAALWVPAHFRSRG